MRINWNDDWAVFDNWLGWSKPTFTMLRGELYNPETHDLVPKESYRKQQLEYKEKLLKALADEREREETRLKEREKELLSEIDELRKSLSPSKKITPAP